jgi:hypothetical protein
MTNQERLNKLAGIKKHLVEDPDEYGGYAREAINYLISRVEALEAIRLAAEKVEYMLNIEDGYEGYVDTDTAAELAEALAAASEQT